MPSTPGTPCAIASCTASMATRMVSRSSLDQREPASLVVPNLRCARAMVRTASTVGVLLSSAPPPLTLHVDEAMKPASRRRGRADFASGESPPRRVGQHGRAPAINQHHAVVVEAVRWYARIGKRGTSGPVSP